MRIEYLLLKNYKRFPLRDTAVFEWRFDGKLYQISGVNGAGKSSLVNELTPLPADKTNFNENGYKEIHIRFKGKLYKLISDFTNGAKFSFLDENDEELNASNNISTQRLLVFKMFGISQASHDIMTGVETFTDMSLIGRKKLFSAISKINIDKVLSGYNELKQHLKDNEAILKNQTTLYQTEEQKLCDSSHTESLKSRLIAAKQYIDMLIDLQGPLSSHLRASQASIEHSGINYHELAREAKAKLSAYVSKYYMDFVVYPYGDLERLRATFTQEAALLSMKLQTSYKRLEELQYRIRLINAAKQTNRSALIEKKNEIELRIRSLSLNSVYISAGDVGLAQAKADMYKLEVSLPEVLRSIRTNEYVDGKRPYTKDTYTVALEDKNSLLHKLNELTSEEISLKKQIDSLTNTSDNVQCPMCDHSWSPNNTPEAIKHSTTHLNKVLASKVEVSLKLEAINKNLEEIIEYFNWYRQFSALRAGTRDCLSLFWDAVEKTDVLYTDPPAILTELKKLNMDILAIEEIESLTKSLVSIDKAIDDCLLIQDSNEDSLNSEMETVINDIDDAQLYKDTVLNKITAINRVAALKPAVEAFTKVLNAANETVCDINFGDTVAEILRVIHSELSVNKVTVIEIEKELHQFNQIQYTMDAYSRTIADVTENIKVLKIALDELSPKNGLIARSVSSFLNVIIGNVNRTISSLWGYKMVLKPIDVDNDALNYKFKVTVEDKLSIEDISIVSKGMKEAINLSFKLVFYKLVGLPGYPAFFDELASNLDKSNSVQMLNLINRLSSTDEFSQIFMITHKENYGSLRGIETIEL